MNDNEKYMRRAIELAKGGAGWTNPNPLVGAVIVKDGVVIGEGFHHKYGELHAERDALRDCESRGNNAKGAEIYVTLEPCCHQGKQPPCTEALVSAGIKKVYVGSRDPNPLVHGNGNRFLREHCVEVQEDFLKDECDKLNDIFFHFITEKTPYVALKYAMTMDGKIATRTGQSKWITGEESRNYVHMLRNRYAAILCGIGTVLADDPMLNARIENGNNPLRIICDGKLRIPMGSKIVESAMEIPTVVVTLPGSDMKKKQALKSCGVEVLELPPAVLENGKMSFAAVDLNLLMKELGQRKIDSVLIEGGGEINYSALKAGVVNYIYAFVAPKIFGGNAKTPVTGEGVALPDEAYGFELKDIKRFGKDVLLEFGK